MFRDQFISRQDGFFLAVIAERPVAQHLEPRQVPSVAAHLVKVVVLAAHAHAGLDRDGTAVAALFLAQEHILELVHPGVGEQQGGVILRNDAAGGNKRMVLVGKIVYERLADFKVIHGCNLRRKTTRQTPAAWRLWL